MIRIANGLLRVLLSAGALAAAVLFASLAMSPASAQKFPEFSGSASQVNAAVDCMAAVVR